MGRRRGTTAFPVARIKKMMQSDDDVGKIATVTPILVAKALECMMELVVTEAARVAIDRRSRTVTPLHLKTCVMHNEYFDFLRHVFNSVEGNIEPVPAQRAGPAEGMREEEEEEDEEEGEGDDHNSTNNGSLQNRHELLPLSPGLPAPSVPGPPLHMPLPPIETLTSQPPHLPPNHSLMPQHHTPPQRSFDANNMYNRHPSPLPSPCISPSPSPLHDPLSHPRSQSSNRSSTIERSLRKVSTRQKRPRQSPSSNNTPSNSMALAAMSLSSSSRLTSRKSRANANLAKLEPLSQTLSNCAAAGSSSTSLVDADSGLKKPSKWASSVTEQDEDEDYDRMDDEEENAS